MLALLPEQAKAEMVPSETMQTEWEQAIYDAEFETLPGETGSWNDLLHPSVRRRHGRGKKASYSSYTPAVKYGVVLSGPAGFHQNSQRAFPPASLSKLFTSALILKELGGDFTYETIVSWQLSPKGDEAGYLRLKSSGNPMLSSRTLADAVAKMLASSGVKTVYGSLTFETTDLRWNERVVPSGWMFDEGKERVPGSLGMSSEPRVRAAFKSRFSKSGVRWQSELAVPFQVVEPERKEWRHTSWPLRELLKPFMWDSINFMGEAFLLKVGEMKGAKSAPDLLSAALPLLQDYVSHHIGNEEVTLYDGSGLSRASRATAEGLTTFLDEMKAEPFYSDFYGALAVMGKEGTVRKRMPGFPGTAARLHAKTGTLTRPRGHFQIAGYMAAPSGDPREALPFVILTESDMTLGAYSRAAQDQVLTKWARSTRF